MSLFVHPNSCPCGHSNPSSESQLARSSTCASQKFKCWSVTSNFMEKGQVMVKTEQISFWFSWRSLEFNILGPLPFCWSWSVGLQVIEKECQVAGQAQSMITQVVLPWLNTTTNNFWKSKFNVPGLILSLQWFRSNIQNNMQGEFCAGDAHLETFPALLTSKLLILIASSSTQQQIQVSYRDKQLIYFKGLFLSSFLQVLHRFKSSRQKGIPGRDSLRERRKEQNANTAGPQWIEASPKGCHK